MNRGVATLKELETWYSIDDVARANAVLDMSDEIEADAAKRIGKEGGK